MTHSETTSHIGIVAGTAEGAALCYRTLCHEAEELMGAHAHPEITLHTFPLRAYLHAIDKDDWPGVAALMSRSAAKLAQAGAQLIICPNNTLHRAYDHVQSPVPWLHIAAVAAAEAARRGFHRVGVLGTRAVMEGSLYVRQLGERSIDHVIPAEQDRARIQDIILRELIAGRFTHSSRAYLYKVVRRLHTSGCDAVILGCTELPLLLSEAHAALPLLDSTRLLARAALQWATSPLRSHQPRDRPISVHSHVSY